MGHIRGVENPREGEWCESWTEGKVPGLTPYYGRTILPPGLRIMMSVKGIL